MTDTVETSASSLLKEGEKKRRQVLGDKHVDKSLKDAHPFELPLQEFVTRYAWGDIWRRHSLSDKSRSLINIALLTALRQPNELKGHIAGALRNGCTSDEIREVIMHTCVYAGAPASLSAMKIAIDALKEAKEI